jgi:hypothetical protein
MVQEWKMIPKFIAWSITSSSRHPIKIPHTQEEVTLAVTAYVISPHKRAEYPVREDPPENDFEFHPVHGNGGIMIEAHAAHYPVLYVAPVEAPGWETGTAVWAHILHSLGAVAPEDPLHAANTKYFQWIFAIAHANPKLSKSLYYIVDPKNNDKPKGFVLYMPVLRSAMLQGSSVFLQKEHFRQVIAHHTPNFQPRYNVPRHRVQEWKLIPEFLAQSISTLSQQPITIPGNTNKEKVTLVITKYTIPPNGHVIYPSKPASVGSLQVPPFWPQWEGPGSEVYPTLHVVPTEAPGWGSGTAVWSHILCSLNAVAKDTLNDVDAEYFPLIESISEANREFSQMLYTKHASINGIVVPIGYVLLTVTGDNPVELGNLYLNGLRKTVS